jgi:hypothetical protein
VVAPLDAVQCNAGCDCTPVDPLAGDCRLKEPGALPAAVVNDQVAELVEPELLLATILQKRVVAAGRVPAFQVVPVVLPTSGGVLAVPR